MRRNRPWMGCLVLMVVMFGCISSTVFVTDRICYSGLSQRLPIYPNSEVVFRRHNLFNEFGMGNTVITLYSTDTPDVVRAWYAQTTGRYLYDALRSPDALVGIARQIAQGDWAVERAPDGVGTQIILFGTCVN